MAEAHDAVLTIVGENIDQLSTWSEQKRNDFCSNFSKRTNFALEAVVTSARCLFEEAKTRFFIGGEVQFPDFPIQGQFLKLQWKGKNCVGAEISQRQDEYHGHHSERTREGKFSRRTGRSLTEMAMVCGDRVAELINDLPESLGVIKIIKPKTAQNMLDLEKLENKHKEAEDKVRELTGTLKIDDFDETMTIKEFKTALKRRQTQKRTWTRKLGEHADTINQLRRSINKALFNGIPELQKATMDAVNEMQQQALAMSRMDRQVVETVKFGDSEACMKALEQFEKDELTLTPEIDQKFKAVVSGLRKKHKLKIGKGKVRRKAPK